VRKVLEASFHQPIFVRGIGQLEKTISTLNVQGAKSLSADMSWDGNHLLIKLTTRQGLTAEVVVPSANVIVALFAPEEKPKAK
jgi:hypothetical protein